jgi:hypothetical protein
MRPFNSFFPVPLGPLPRKKLLIWRWVGEGQTGMTFTTDYFNWVAGLPVQPPRTPNGRHETDGMIRLTDHVISDRDMQSLIAPLQHRTVWPVVNTSHEVKEWLTPLAPSGYEVPAESMVPELCLLPRLRSVIQDHCRASHLRPLRRAGQNIPPTGPKADADVGQNGLCNMQDEDIPSKSYGLLIPAHTNSTASQLGRVSITQVGVKLAHKSLRLVRGVLRVFEPGVCSSELAIPTAPSTPSNPGADQIEQALDASVSKIALARKQCVKPLPKKSTSSTRCAPERPRAARFTMERLSAQRLILAVCLAAAVVAALLWHSVERDDCSPWLSRAVDSQYYLTRVSAGTRKGSLKTLLFPLTARDRGSRQLLYSYERELQLIRWSKSAEGPSSIQCS